MAAEMAWYVLRAVSGKEGKVKEYIDAEIKNGRLGGHVSQVLIPTEKVKQVQGNKQVVKERLYLPGYVLVSLEQLPKLRGCQAHCTVMLSDVDQKIFKKLGVDITCEPVLKK